ncbi:MAG: hypothetical protein II808_04445, partial [Clostridia bacterium]|nr:hypothetical protein [Clostridia bacterium]
AVSLLIVVSIFNYAKLNELSFEATTIQNETKLIESEIVRLNVEINRITDISNVEKKAEELGMVKTDSSNIKYISIPSEDRVEQASEETGGFLSSIAKGLSIILAYFS